MFPRRPYLRQPAPRPQLEKDEQFYPTISDVFKVQYVLLWKVRPGGLPAEVVDMILDLAEYWPSTEVRLEEERTIRQDIDEALLITSPLCYDETTLDTPSPRVMPHRTTHPCRKIVFRIVSHDQGGSGQADTYSQSWTWFDVEFIHKAYEATQRDAVRETMNPEVKRRKHFGPNDPMLLPSSNRLQVNRTRQSQPHQHNIVWHYLDNINADSPKAAEIAKQQGRGQATLAGHQVREMEIGDSIMVWAKARFPGWANYVQHLSIRVFWAV